MTFLVFAALLPAAVLMWYIYTKDKVEKEPAGLVAKVFFLGVIAGPIAAIIENILFGIFESVIPQGMLLLIIEYFIGVAAVEEICKYTALNSIRNNPAFNYVFDGVVYGVAAALGFAALENVLYVMDGGLAVAIQRAVFSVPGHASDGAIMGCFYGLARKYELLGDKKKSATYRKYSLLIPILEHGLYDFGLSTESDLLVLGSLALEIAFMIVAIVLVKNMAKNDEPFATTPQQPPYYR